MKTFEPITEFVVPRDICDETDAQLREAGRKGAERFVLWSGTVELTRFQVRTLHVPRQTAYRLPEGLCVRVEGTELHRLNVWLYENHELLAIQVHAHPTEAYHSETDDTYPIVTTRGGLSLVVPDFARDGLRGPGTALYRLGLSGWQELAPPNARILLKLER
ncbi:MAG: Mov34/MPN/PAD-1 family protein [Steroidobacteraceae bacterium]